MRQTTLSVVFGILLICAADGFGQGNYQGLTPGKSTRSDAERVLGPPLQAVSETLSEYGSGKDKEKTFVQYRRESDVIERVELVYTDPRARHEVVQAFNLPQPPTASQITPAKRLEEYFGAPWYLVLIHGAAADQGPSVSRVGYYSPELFARAVAKLPPGSFAQSGSSAGSAGVGAAGRAVPAIAAPTATAPARPSREEPQRRADLGVREERAPPSPSYLRPAEPGLYETIRTTMARTGPSDSAEVVDPLRSGTRVNVTGSQGDWLVVFSKTRNRTVFVKRDDAMLMSGGTVEAARDPESKWREIEGEIQRALAGRGIAGVTVAFVRDTAYLRGTVQSEEQRTSAESTARSFPEVIHISNGIRVNR